MPIITRVLYLLTALLLTAATAAAQQLRPETDSLGQVLQRARQLRKPVFLFFPAAPAPGKLTKQQMAQRYKSGFDDAAVVQVLQQEFLVVKANMREPAGQRLARRYAINTFPTYLYLHPDGTVLHRSYSNTPDAARYLRDIDTFRQKLASPDNLSALEQRYAQGERAPEFLRQYIGARRSVGAPISPELLDQYVRELPVKAFERLEQVVFVYECGPLVDSRAYRLARLNQRLVDSMYATLPLPRRVALNNGIISNTMLAAIKAKDEKLAVQGANFAQGSWQASRNYQMAARAYSGNMLHYYSAVQDTARYLPMLTSFYERFYMNTPADTVRRWQQRQQAARSPFQNELPYPNLARLDSGVKVRIMPPTMQFDPVDADLNNGAWALYKSGTRRNSYLMQALRWSQRSVALDPRAAYYDTMAHLLYALHFPAEAVATQQRAVAQARQAKEPADGFEQTLRKMKAGTLN
ncbi:hypothetical protein [Hymenobacter yonginensis]|uniref:Thioredoxin domain-containing protein n=1 Tax=Hymenobacter yonginensis TaxID=748197 RepID=A0ABY7PNK5_9BACT|nr:hypothetical protein [Hymenobacter yonginensis]WBO84341.1 hypothetical protein O9Z63_18460 [Hymenobacter yonginensis]